MTTREAQGRPTLRTLVSTPGYVRVLASSLVARLESSMSALALVLLVVHRGGSYALAGTATATWAVAGGIASPVVSRLADRLGPRRVLLPTAAVSGVVLSVLALWTPRTPLPLVALAALAGAAIPPVTSTARGLWPRLLPTDALRREAFALEASVQELVYVVGPIVVGGCVVVSPVAGLLAAAVFCVGGTFAFATTPAMRAVRPRPRATASGRTTSVQLVRPLLPFLLAAVLMTTGFGIVELAVAGLATEHHAAGLSGVLLACWAVGSMTGGLTLGARLAGKAPARRLPWLLAVMGAGTAPAGAGPGLLGVGALLLVGGAAIAPAMTCLYLSVERAAPPGRSTEAFGWLGTAFLVGAAVGSAAGGAAVQALGPRPAFVVAALAPACAGPLVVLLRRRLSAGPATPPGVRLHPPLGPAERVPAARGAGRPRECVPPERDSWIDS